MSTDLVRGWVGRTRPINKYVSLATISFRQAINYRAALFVNISLTFLWVIVVYHLWRAAYAGRPLFAGYTWEDMRTYVVLAYGINALVGWRIGSLMMSTIRTGEIAIDMVRPLDYCGSQLARSAGYSVVEGMLGMALTLVVGILFLGIRPPHSAGEAALFILSLLLGFLIKSLLVFCISLIMFWTTNGFGVMLAQEAVIQVLSGALVPIALMPEALRVVASVLPMRGIVATPVNIYLGHSSGTDAALQLGLQALWVVVLAVLASLAWRRAFRRVEIQGG